MTTKTYDPSEVSVIIGGQIITGFDEGDSIEVAMNEDAFTLKVGSQGDATRTKNANLSGTLKLVLQQASEANAVLQGLLTQDQLSGNGTFPFLVRDNSGNDVHKAETAWVKRQPNAAYGKESGTREWMIESGRVLSILGGN